jgi:hypothetical protein
MLLRDRTNSCGGLLCPEPTLARFNFRDTADPFTHYLSSPGEGPSGMIKNIQFLRKHREAVGPDFPLRVDCYMSCEKTPSELSFWCNADFSRQ